MAYSYQRRSELAAQRLEMLGVERDYSVSAYTQEKKLGLTNLDKRAEYVREHDWFYQGTTGTTSRGEPGRYDSHQTAKDYVQGFLYEGKQTKGRKEARNRFREKVNDAVDWQLWRDYRLGYARFKRGEGPHPIRPVEEEDIYYEEEYMEGEEDE